MPQVIPIQPVPSQIVLVVLGGQNCQINIYLRNESLYVDLNSNGVDMCIGCIALDSVPLDACNSYDGFQGNIYIVDTQGNDDPVYTGLGSRWVLVYLTPAEVLLTAFSPIGIPSILQLANVFTITAPNAGDFTFAHGLPGIPYAVEILPNSPSAIWGQAVFADETNLYLVASDIDATAIVLVYLAPTLTDVTRESPVVQIPAKTLLADSPSSPTFAIPHNLGAIPSFIEVLPTSFGWMWQISPPDYSNVYLAASAEGVTASITVFGQTNIEINIAKPANILEVASEAPGTFSKPHGLGAMPSRIAIFMLSDGQIIAQTPAFDATNVYLSASDVGRIALISVYA